MNSYLNVSVLTALMEINLILTINAWHTLILHNIFLMSTVVN